MRNLFACSKSLISGFGLGPRCSLNVTNLCLPNNESDAKEETENIDKSLSCDGDLNIRHETANACCCCVADDCCGCCKVDVFGVVIIFNFLLSTFLF